MATHDEATVRSTQVTNYPSYNAMNEPGYLRSEGRDTNVGLCNITIGTDRGDVAAVHHPRECVSAISIENYDDLPANVTLNPPPWVQRKKERTESEIAKEGEELIPKVEVNVLPMYVGRLQNVGKDEILAMYRICSNIIHKHARKRLLK